jgi:hypothetical protein
LLLFYLCGKRPPSFIDNFMNLFVSLDLIVDYAQPASLELQSNMMRDPDSAGELLEYTQ